MKDPRKLTKTYPPLPYRVWPHVRLGPDCWEWTGGPSIRYLCHAYRPRLIMRLLVTGVGRRGGKMGRPHCGNLNCVRPSHFL